MLRRTYTIFSENVAELQKIVDRANRRAVKLNLTPIVLNVGQQTEKLADDGVTLEQWTDVTLIGETPRLNGWEFAATLQHLTDDDGQRMNVLRINPEFEGELPEEFRTSDPSRCDHCQKYRQRADTYIVYNGAEDRFAQVGSNCLADFIGTDKVGAAATMAELIFLVTDAVRGMDNDHGMRQEERYQLDMFLAYVAQAVIQFGWLSRGKAREIDGFASVDYALQAIRNQQKGQRCTWKCPRPCGNHFTPTPQAIEMATTVLEWAPDFIERELRRNDSDYIWNLNVALKASSVPIRATGIAGSVIGCYQREQERLVKARREAEASTSDWQGTVGDKLTVELTPVSTREINGAYGCTTLITYEDAAKNIYTWFASGYHTPKLNEPVMLAGTVKDHTEFRGVKQTVLTRVKPHVVKPAKRGKGK